MILGKLYPPPPEHLTSWVNGTVYVPIIDWDSCVGTDTIVASLLVAQVIATGGTGTVQLAYQTAQNRIDAPDSWQTLSLSQAGAGSVAATISVASATSGKMWIRWGLAFITSGVTTFPAHATAKLNLATVAKGMPVGSWRGQLTSSATTDGFQVISGFVPVAWAQAAVVGLIVTSASNNFKWRLYYRTATASQDAPGAWTAFAHTGGTSNGETVVTETLTLGNNMWVQFAVGFQSSSGTSSADLAIATFARRT